MRNLLYKIEKLLTKKSPECRFDLQKSHHILILPGLSGYVGGLFALVRYFRNSQVDYAVTAIPLGLNSASLNTIVQGAAQIIEEGLFKKSKPKKVILLGHSFGGRIACMLVNELKKKYPDVVYEVMTLGSPLGSLRSGYLPWYKDLIFAWFSVAYRQDKLIIQPNQEATKFVGLYSKDDKLVSTEFAKSEYKGKLIELAGLSHNDLICPIKIGPEISKLLKE